MKKKVLLFIGVFIFFNISYAKYSMEDIEIWKKSMPKYSMEEKEYRADILDYFKLYKLNFEEVKHCFGYFDSNGYKLAVHGFFPKDKKEKGLVVIMHGYLVHTGYLRKIIEFLLENDYAVIAYDMPGHGLSSGEVAGIRKFEQYSAILDDFISKYRDYIPENSYIIGHSTGCSAIIDYANNYDDVFKKRILLSPLIRSSMWHISKFGCNTIGIFLKRVPRFFRNSSSNEEYLEFQKNIDPIKIKRIPMSWTKALYKWNKSIKKLEFSNKKFVIIQGKKDGVVDWEYNMEFLEKKLINREFYYFEEAKHDLLNEKENIQKEVFNIILSQIKEN